MAGSKHRSAPARRSRAPAPAAGRPRTSPAAGVALLIAAGSADEGLQRTLESALAQRLPDTQVLLLLASGCDCPQLPAPPPPQLQVVHCPQAGRAAAFNLGLARCTGEAVACLEAGWVLDVDFAGRLYAQLLAEDAELCHGEYAVPAPGGNRVCSDAAALARSDASPLACLGVPGTTLWRRSFLEAQQLRFDEALGGGCELVFQVRALLACRRWALCEDCVADCPGQPQAQLEAAELRCRLSTCHQAAQLLCSAGGDLPERALVRALAWLVAEVRDHLAWQAGAEEAAACHQAAEVLQAQCPPRLQAALAAELEAQTAARAALGAPLYRALEQTVDDPPPPWPPLQVQAVAAQLRARLLECCGSGHDDVYLLLMHLGDAYTWLCFMGALIARHQSRSPVLAAWSPQHEQLAAMVRPDLPRLRLPGPPEGIAYCERLIGAPQIRVGALRIFMCPSLHVLHRRIDLPRRRSGFSHKLDNFAHYFGCRARDLDLPRLQLLPEAEAEALREARRHGLDVRRFVMLCPEAYSFTGPGWPFWRRLADAMRERGYGVYVNATLPGTWPAEAGRTFPLSLAAACALAFRAQRIIILRCGLSEVLAQSGVAMDVIYNNPYFRHYTTLSRYPHVNAGQLREYDLVALGEERCLRALLERPMP